MRYPVDSSRFGFDSADEKAAAHRRARSWVEHPEVDDVHCTNELHAYKDANVKVWMRTLDVIHSLTMPNLRLKQDVLPGKTIPMWFRAEKSNCRFVLKERGRGPELPVVLDEETKEVKVRMPGSQEAVPLAGQLANLRGEMVSSGNKKDAWELACQELCGARHYAMRGRLYIHEDARSFYAWLRFTQARQRARTLETSVAMDK